MLCEAGKQLWGNDDDTVEFVNGKAAAAVTNKRLLDGEDLFNKTKIEALKIPQQADGFSCDVFVIHYIRHILKNDSCKFLKDTKHFTKNLRGPGVDFRINIVAELAKHSKVSSEEQSNEEESDYED